MQNIWQHIYAAFIEADRWKLYLKGLGVTLEVSFFAALLGILIGTIAAFLLVIGFIYLLFRPYKESHSLHVPKSISGKVKV